MPHLKGERREECEQRVCLLGLLQGKATSTKKPSIVSDEGKVSWSRKKSMSTNRARVKRKRRKKMMKKKKNMELEE